MVTILDVNSIVLNMIDYMKAAQPNADTKPATVIRDLFIDMPASQIALLYSQLGNISNLQSLRLVSGSDLDKLAQNFGATRKAATKSSGIALLTFSSIPATIGITAGSLITASNGATFTVQNGITVNPAQANTYKSTAVQFQANLSFEGITDQYAVEVTVQASTAGSSGNITQYSLTQTSIPGVSNVTNVYPFTGGADQENDATFRNRVLAIFSGSNVGTALGYQNIVLSDPSVSDAIVIGPGNPLMTRDGSVVVKNSNGTYTIVSQGTGGKVDIIVLGSTLTQYTDTFIYLDKSNDNDPTNPVNNYVLGQIAADAGLTITQKRLNDIANGTLPAQPVEQILSVTGTMSGTNFIPATTNDLGITTGNYELIKDTGNYAGSPWGMDTFHWTSNQIVFNEDLVKGQFNGQDPTTFTGVVEIPNVQQNISISSENSQVSSSNNSLIQLLHTPATNVTRVFNVNTGETYTVINQNVNGTGATNTSGVIQISGNTLPSTNNILQVDYTWIVSYDPFSDFDGKILHNNPRPITDSVDWDMSNAVRYERVQFASNTSTLFIGYTTHPITTVISANYFSFTRGAVISSTVVNFTTRLAISIAAVDNPMNTIESVKLTNTFQELYNTDEDDGFIVNNSIVIGSQIKYNVVIVLPTDTSATLGDEVSITYNQIDAFNVVGSTGSTSGSQVTIPIDNIPTTDGYIYLDVTYLAALQNLLTTGITGFPLSKAGNGYLTNNSVGSINAIKSNTMRRENQTIQTTGSGATPFYVTLSIDSINFSLVASQIVSVIDLATGLELWDSNYTASVGVISSNTNNNYVLTFTGYNAPAAGNNVLVIYFATDINRVQPFTYSNPINKLDIQLLQYNFTTDNFYVPIQNFIVETGITYNIIDNTTGLVVGTKNDGYIASVNSNGSIATFGGSLFAAATLVSIQATLPTSTISVTNTTGFATSGVFTVQSFTITNNVATSNGIQIVSYTGLTPTSFTGCSGGVGVVIAGSVVNYTDDITGKSIQLVNTVNVNNKGVYDIFSIANNEITIGLPLANLTANQVSIIRLSDSADLWTSAGDIDATDNILNLPASTVAAQGEEVIVILFNSIPLHQSPTRLAITTADQVINTGIVTAYGTTATQVASVVFVAINNGLQQNALAAFKTFLGLNSNATIPSNMYIVRVVEVQKVTVTTGNQILSTVATYDVQGTNVPDNTLYPNEMILNTSLENTQFVLPPTTNNLNNAPSIGDSLLITFYFATNNDSENLYFTKNGTLYTNKKFAFLEEMYISSGFNASQSTRFTVAFFTQPATGSRYTAFYNYLAPKQNERILIQYNYNQTITDCTFLVETSRPITADVLVKEAQEFLVDVTMNVIVTTAYTNQVPIVLQNVNSAVTATINNNTLGASISSSALVAAAQAVSGVQGVVLLGFNQDGVAGQVITLTCQENQYFVANSISINQETS
jgi:uncharacterized phage protein gp47/JayE